MATPSTAINRFELGATFTEFDLMSNAMGFVAQRVLVPRLVAKQSGDFGKVPLEQLLAARTTTLRAPGASYQRDAFTFTTASFACREYGKEAPLDDAEQAMYGDIIDGETIAADRAKHDVIAEYERDVAAMVFNASTWAGAGLFLAVTNEWDDFANATPISDVNTAVNAVEANSGIQANALVVNRKVFRNLVQCNQIIDRLKYTQTPTVDQVRNALADLLGLRYLIVAGGLKSTANEGQTAAISRIWSDEYAMICRVAETPDPREPCIGRTYIWSGDNTPTAPGDGGQLAMAVEEYRDEKVRGSVFRARLWRDQSILYTEAGFLLGNITT